jgi:hypothetical protein
MQPSEQSSSGRTGVSDSTPPHFRRQKLTPPSPPSVRLTRCGANPCYTPLPSWVKTRSLSALTPAEANHLRSIVDELSRPEARDPKLAAVRYFLTEHRTEGKTWLEHGCIIFSQYYDTAYSLAAELAKSLRGEPVGFYAGVGKSGLFLEA